MSFGVIVDEHAAPAAQGAPVEHTSQAFVDGASSNGAGLENTERTLVQVGRQASRRRSPSAHGRQGPSRLWDPGSGVSFREGLTQAYVGGYEAPGDYAEGLALFDSRLGPGQVTVVGEPASATVYGDLQAHVDAYNRIGLLDTNDGDDQSMLLAHGTDAQGLPSQENVGVFGSWASCAGPPGVVASTGRLVPASAVIAGLCSRVDQQGNPNRAAGGRDFPLQYVTGFEVDPDDTDRAALFAVGVNMFADRYGVLEIRVPGRPSLQSPDAAVLAAQLRTGAHVAQGAGARCRRELLHAHARRGGQAGGAARV